MMTDRERRYYDDIHKMRLQLENISKNINAFLKTQIANNKPEEDDAGEEE